MQALGLMVLSRPSPLTAYGGNSWRLVIRRCDGVAEERASFTVAGPFSIWKKPPVNPVLLIEAKLSKFDMCASFFLVARQIWPFIGHLPFSSLGLATNVYLTLLELQSACFCLCLTSVAGDASTVFSGYGWSVRRKKTLASCRLLSTGSGSWVKFIGLWAGIEL